MVFISSAQFYCIKRETQALSLIAIWIICINNIVEGLIVDGLYYVKYISSLVKYHQNETSQYSLKTAVPWSNYSPLN